MSFGVPPTQSSGSFLNVFANIFRCGSSWITPAPRPRDSANNAPFLLRDTAPPVFTLSYATRARPVAGSISMTLLASLFANSILPPSAAIGPSALLPCHCQTTFHAWPAAMTPGIAVVAAGVAGAGGSWSSPGERLMLSRLRTFGLVAHFASSAPRSGLCHACSPVPRLNEDEGLCAEAAAAAQPTSTARASVVFIGLPPEDVV